MPNVNVRSSFSSRVLLSSALAVIAVSGALTYTAIHSATNIESQAIVYPNPKLTPTPTTPPPELNIQPAQFQVCASARGQCANCHYFIPDSPPGCGGLMGANPPLKSPAPGTINPHTGKPTPGRNRNPQSEQTYDHIWQAHPGAGPIVSTAAFITSPSSVMTFQEPTADTLIPIMVIDRFMHLHYGMYDIVLKPEWFSKPDRTYHLEIADIPLPTCFPCPSSQNVLSSVTTEVNTRSWWMDLPDEKNNHMLGVMELVR